MPLRPRRDIIDRHSNIARRVRALETGAHPMGAGLDFGHSKGMSNLPADLAGWNRNPAIGITNYPARYRKRLSTVQFYGMFSGQLGAIPVGTGVKISHVSADCAPGVDMDHFIVGNLTRAPFSTRLGVKANGDVYIYNMSGFANDGTVDFVSLSAVRYIADPENV